ncbi:MAG: DnaJ domain-containing protein, partial [Pyramidobacter sp.]|nr:DnaJ domain-containing protein [Pyramidobacter sp.]
APKSAYEVFGLPRSASDDEIRARYRELISKYHPDKFAGLNDPEFSRLAAEKFQQVQGAYEELRRLRGM